MKKFILSLALLLTGGLHALPAKANSKAENCLNTLVQTELPVVQGSVVTRGTSITHNGEEYHLVRLAKDPTSPIRTEVIFKLDPQQKCHLVLFSPDGPLPSRAHYNDVLGVEVMDKIVQAARKQN